MMPDRGFGILAGVLLKMGTYASCDSLADVPDAAKDPSVRKVMVVLRS